MSSAWSRYWRRKVSEDAAIQAASAAVGTAWILAACFLSVNRMAGMLTSGIPGMAGGQSVGGLVRMMATGAAATATVGGAAVVGGLALTGGSRAAVQAVHALHSGTSQSLGRDRTRHLCGGKDAAHGQGTLGKYMGDPTRLVAQSRATHAAAAHAGGWPARPDAMAVPDTTNPGRYL